MHLRTAVLAPIGLAPIGLALVGLALAGHPPALAQDRVAGRTKAVACQVCHGMDGVSRQPDAPNIAGQNAFYMREQLIKYRSGARAHPVMNIIAGNLSDSDIDDLAAYYASIKITVEIPE